MNGHFLLHLGKGEPVEVNGRTKVWQFYFLFLMRLDEHGFRHHFTSERLPGGRIDELVASCEATLNEEKSTVDRQRMFDDGHEPCRGICLWNIEYAFGDR